MRPFLPTQMCGDFQSKSPQLRCENGEAFRLTGIGYRVIRAFVLQKWIQNTICVVTRLQPGSSMVRIPSGTKCFASLKCPDVLWSPTSYSTITDFLLSGVKKPGSEFVQLPAASTEVKHECSHASSPPVCIHGM